jgi:sugar lactone lactonase YvrE
MSDRVSRSRVVARPTILALTTLLVALAAGAPAAAQDLGRRALRYAAVVDGSAERALRWPVDVAAASSDELAVADAWESRLVVFRRLGASWATAREVPLPAPPAAVAVVGGRYVVALRGLSRLVAVPGGASEAAPQEIALPEGVLPGRLAASSDGTLIAWDSRRGRVVKLRDGAIVSAVAIDGAVTALASDGVGGFWVAIGEAGELRRFDNALQLVATWRVPAETPITAWPSGIAVEPGGRLFVLDRHAHRVVVLDSTGALIGLGASKGWEPGQLLYPTGLARLPNGSLFVGDGGNGRTQLFDLVGAGAR